MCKTLVNSFSRLTIDYTSKVHFVLNYTYVFKNMYNFFTLVEREDTDLFSI